MNADAVVVQAKQMLRVIDSRGKARFKKELKEYVKAAKECGCSSRCIKSIVKELKGAGENE